LGAGSTPNNRAELIRWIAETQEVKPGVHMPHFGMLPREELEALAAYVESLR
jgi:cytochrome c oxidase subunit 2